ncbi:MAG: Gmad2 immunoglobulin-like domain-containing protein [Dermatophilaceae bacterium]
MRDDELTPRPTDHDLEARLRAALHAHAHRATPGYRLETILTEAGAVASPTRRTGWWALGALAAAALLAVALLLPGLLRGSPDAAPAVPAATPSESDDPVPTATEATPPATPTGTPQPTEPTADDRLAAIPVYLVAQIGDDLRAVRLYREWVNVDGVTRDAPAEQRARGALETALSGSAPGTDGYLYSWDGVTLEDVEVGTDRITVTLSGPGPSSVDDEWARISVQQLVWTAQAAVGEGAVPVRFDVADGSEQLFGRLPTDRDYNRPASTDLYYEDLAPIWINSPTRGQVIDGADVVVSGEATTFEGAFSWELLDPADGSVLRSGTGQASAGGPARGTYEIALGGLDAGDYQIRVFELSAEDGTTVSAERTIPFTVR